MLLASDFLIELFATVFSRFFPIISPISGIAALTKFRPTVLAKESAHYLKSGSVHQFSQRGRQGQRRLTLIDLRGRRE